MRESCDNCQKGEPDVTLKRCAKCSVALYCSRNCQKADWKAHKRACGQTIGRPATSSRSANRGGMPTPKGLDVVIDKPFTCLDNNTWLEGRTEKDVFRLLIDAYRLRVADMYNFDGERDESGIYGDRSDVLGGFSRFLQAAAAQPGILPRWWNALKATQCEELGMDGSQWYDLHQAIQKDDIVEHYEDTYFPMQLRMFCETIYGRAPGGADSRAMRAALMARE